MTTPPVLNATIDPVRNLARVRFSGDLTAAGMQAAAAEVARLLPGLKPGFKILADFSLVVSMDLESTPHLTRIMELCRTHGVGLVVRVLPSPDRDIGINILSVVHYRAKVKTVTVDNLDEAERALS